MQALCSALNLQSASKGLEKNVSCLRSSPGHCLRSSQDTGSSRNSGHGLPTAQGYASVCGIPGSCRAINLPTSLLRPINPAHRVLCNSVVQNSMHSTGEARKRHTVKGRDDIHTLFPRSGRLWSPATLESRDSPRQPSSKLFSKSPGTSVFPPNSTSQCGGHDVLWVPGERASLRC